MSFREGFGNLDGTADFSRVDTTHSEGIIQDARQLVCQSRSNGNTYLTETCTSLGAWTVHTGGTVTERSLPRACSAVESALMNATHFGVIVPQSFLFTDQTNS